MAFRMRAVYLPPTGGPLYWRNEESGMLRAAVEAYLSNRVDSNPISPAEVDLVAEYVRHWINAPCWQDGADPELRSELQQLRETAKPLRNADDIDAWIHAALDLGIDPL